MDRSLTAGIAITSLTLVAQHWAPYPRRLPCLAAYTLGTLGILAGVTTWLTGHRGPLSTHEAITGLVIIDVAGGAAVAGCYIVDGLLHARAIEKANNHARCYER